MEQIRNAKTEIAKQKNNVTNKTSENSHQNGTSSDNFSSKLGLRLQTLLKNFDAHQVVVFFTLLIVIHAHAELSSPFSSTVSGLTIPNSHIVSRQTGSLVVRGQAPKPEEMDQLKKLGVQRVLIFKNEIKGEVAKEISDLKMKGYHQQDVRQVNMPWKDITSFQDACEMTLESLQFIEDSAVTRRSVYFHCSVGEDRTGYLAGLWGLWSGEYRDVNRAFRDEMCARGYEAGDYRKPMNVVQAVRQNLTPTFVKMVQILSDARKRGLQLKQIRCPKEVELKFQLPRC